jgi:hypothetical protein
LLEVASGLHCRVHVDPGVLVEVPHLSLDRLEPFVGGVVEVEYGEVDLNDLIREESGE